jgi:hypothetical protein
MTTKPRLKKFDKAVFEVIQSGVYRVANIANKLHVDERALRERLNELAIVDYVVFGDGGDSVRLGVEGFNKMPKKRKRSKGSAKKKAVKKQMETPEEKKGDAPASKTIEPKKIIEENEKVASPSNEVDLQALLKTGAPPNESLFVARQRAKQETEAKKDEEPIVRTEAKPLTKGGDEVCELCKSKFSLSVNGKGHPKFGHCFCGAAYHKDCYEALIGSTKKCVRCGKTLKLYLNKDSEEAVRVIRGVFD